MTATHLTEASGNMYSPDDAHTGKSGDPTLYAGIVGGSGGGYNLLKILDAERQSKLHLKLVAFSDEDPHSPGYRYAKELGLFTSTNFESLFSLENLNLIIELTGSSELREQIYAKKPPGVSVLDHRISRLFWDILEIQSEITSLEDDFKRREIKSKIKTQVIFDTLPYRIMVVNLDMTVDTVNQTFLREFKLDSEEIEGKHCYELRYGLDKSCKQSGRVCYLEDKLDEILDKGLFNTVRQFIDQDGATRYEVITIAPIFDENGKLIQLLEASRDVTDRSQLEKDFEKSTIFFENVIDSAVDGIVVVDTKGKVLIFNEGMEKLTGYSAEQMQSAGHLTHFYDIDTAKENMRKMRSLDYGPPGKLNPTPMTIRDIHGNEIPVTLSASIIRIDGKEIGSVGVFTDMREVLHMKKELEDAHLKLVQAEKIASVGRMAAGIAHEINNPLSGALIYAELLKEELRDNAHQSRDVQEIIDQTLRCKKIVSEMLEFSRQSVGKTSSFSLEFLLNKCLNLLIHQAIFQNIEVVKKIEPYMPQMIGDIGQLQQVFTNLFINAAHAMESKGRLGIQAHYDKTRSVFVIKVSDSGPGVPRDLRDKIFEMFFTTKPVGMGTGLGLSISQNIIKLHGGTISLDCPEEGGSIFTIELPLEFSESPVDEEAVFV